MKLKVNRFDPAGQMKPHRIILMVGRRGTGKSRLAEDLMFRLRGKLDFGIAMSPSEETQQMYRTHMPDSWVFSAFSCQKLEQMMAMQRANIRAGKVRHLFLIADDCTYDKKIWKSTAIRDLFLNGRHTKITFIMSSQYIMDLGPDLRNNVDYVFCFKQNIISEKRKLWSYFFGVFESFAEFSRVFDRCCENYGCLVLDQTAPTSDLSDTIFWYRSELQLPPYKIGNPVFHTLSEKHKRRAPHRESSGGSIVIEKDNRITAVQRADKNGKPIREDR
jgi:hypothetical protein